MSRFLQPIMIGTALVAGVFIGSFVTTARYEGYLWLRGIVDERVAAASETLVSAEELAAAQAKAEGLNEALQFERRQRAAEQQRSRGFQRNNQTLQSQIEEAQANAEQLEKRLQGQINTIRDCDCGISQRFIDRLRKQ